MKSPLPIVLRSDFHPDLLSLLVLPLASTIRSPFSINLAQGIYDLRILLQHTYSARRSPKNSTGAYEFDLSLVDANRAWRTMHVKTDVFCGASIVLPDKAGRQLSLAGWNGASGYAVRFYTPDGSPGIEGKNDWEEDAEYVKLQVNHISVFYALVR